VVVAGTARADVNGCSGVATAFDPRGDGSDGRCARPHPHFQMGRPSETKTKTFFKKNPNNMERKKHKKALWFYFGYVTTSEFSAGVRARSVF
jgi:hypothetical protein